MVSLKTIIKKRERLTRDWTKPRCTHTSSKAKGRLTALRIVSCFVPVPTGLQVRQSVVKLSVNCLNLLCFPLQLVSQVCKVSAPVPEMNRNLVLSKLHAENHPTCLSHTFSRSNYFILFSL